MWTHQSTCTHKGPPGARVFCLFRMERPIHHWLFVTETGATVSLSVSPSVPPSTCLLITHIYSTSGRAWFVRVRKISGRNSAFSAPEHHGCGAYCLQRCDKSCSSTVPTKNKSSQMFKHIFWISMSMWWMSIIDFVHDAQTMELKTNAGSVCDNKNATAGCVTVAVL